MSAYSGVVQGVGFRPFVYTTAASLGLAGTVRNDSAGAVIEVEGDTADVDTFLIRLRDQPPPLAVIEAVEVERVPLVGGTGFTIADTITNRRWPHARPPPTSPCAPTAQPNNATPLTGATDTHSSTAPTADRASPSSAHSPMTASATTMAAFEMCTDCAREYHDPADRRFHAQPVCCPNCGPALTYRDGNGRTTDGESGLGEARRLLRDGGVLAVKGIGGYHLACDAANERAVIELRSRKRRGDKPFAVMAPDLATARSIAEVDGALSTHAVRYTTADRAHVTQIG